MNRMHYLSAIELRDAFLKGEITAQNIAQHFLKRIEKHGSALGAFLSVLGPRVLLKAEALDKKRAHGKPLGKLAGIPIAIKDNMHIAGEITTCGSKFLKNYKAPFDATAVRLLEEEDALLIGKTNLDEFAMGSSNENSAYFPVHNPWNLNAGSRRIFGRVCGGGCRAACSPRQRAAIQADRSGSPQAFAESSDSNRPMAAFPAMASSPSAPPSIKSAPLPRLSPMLPL